MTARRTEFISIQTPKLVIERLNGADLARRVYGVGKDMCSLCVTALKDYRSAVEPLEIHPSEHEPGRHLGEHLALVRVGVGDGEIIEIDGYGSIRISHAGKRCPAYGRYRRRDDALTAFLMKSPERKPARRE